MSNKCKNTTCDKEVVSIEGRRPKKFCSVECRTKFHNSKKATGTGRGRPKGSKNKHNAIDQVEADNRNNPLTNAARGRDESGVNEDEVRNIVGFEATTTTYLAFEMKPLEEIGIEMNVIAIPKWDFSKVIYLNVEDFTEYPKAKCPASGYERNEYLAKKKESDDNIREAFRNYKK